MKAIDIVGENYFGKWDKTRTACRGIIIDGSKILLSYETKTDQLMIPGGGVEYNERVKREYQGKGLSNPLITYVINVMKSLGHSRAKVPTQTNTWLACKVYLDLGFLPIKENLEHSYEGWKIVKELTNHSALKDI